MKYKGPRIANTTLKMKIRLIHFLDFTLNDSNGGRAGWAKTKTHRGKESNSETNPHMYGQLYRPAGKQSFFQ
jgi:hypothetical protein